MRKFILLFCVMALFSACNDEIGDVAPEKSGISDLFPEPDMDAKGNNGRVMDPDYYFETFNCSYYDTYTGVGVAKPLINGLLWFDLDHNGNQDVFAPWNLSNSIPWSPSSLNQNYSSGLVIYPGGYASMGWVQGDVDQINITANTQCESHFTQSWGCYGSYSLGFDLYIYHHGAWQLYAQNLSLQNDEGYKHWSFTDIPARNNMAIALVAHQDNVRGISLKVVELI